MKKRFFILSGFAWLVSFLAAIMTAGGIWALVAKEYEYSALLAIGIVFFLLVFLLFSVQVQLTDTSIRVTILWFTRKQINRNELKAIFLWRDPFFYDLFLNFGNMGLAFNDISDLGENPSWLGYIKHYKKNPELKAMFFPRISKKLISELATDKSVKIIGEELL